MIIEKQFRRFVMKELKEQGLSLPDLARLMGVSRAMVHQYLRDREPTRPGPEVIERFSKALGFVPVLEFKEIRERQPV